MSYIYKYRTPISFSAIFNVFYSLLTLVSIPLIIPFFQLLFEREATQKDNESWVETYIYNFYETVIGGSGREQALLIVCVLFVVVILLRNVFRYLSLWVMAPVRNGIIADIRTQLHSKIFRLPTSYFSEERKGDLMSKSIADVQEVEWSILQVIETVFRSPILLVGALGIMIAINAKLTLMVLVLVAVTVLILGLTGKRLRAVSRKIQSSLGKLTSIIEESISGVRIIKTYNAESAHDDRFTKENNSYKKSMIKAFRLKDLSAPLSETLGMTIVGFLMYLGAKEVFEDQLSPESFFAFLFAFYQVIEPSKALSNAYFNIQKGMAAVDRIEGVLSFKEIVYDQNRLIQSWGGLQKQIKIDSLNFTYLGADVKALQNISLEINKGEKVAFVGPSGSGKSTLANIICRLYQSDQGSISIDDYPIQDIPLLQYRNHIGLVSQDPVLFNEDIRFNITLGKSGYDDKQIIEALTVANAWSFVEDLPNKISTKIGDSGMKLSGGQKQRLSIARAVLHKPDILVFDEATSALDTESEKIVQQSIDKLTKDRTSIIIAHRLSTIFNADKIVVFDKGKIVGIGDHDSLSQSNSLYKTLIKDQYIK